MTTRTLMPVLLGLVLGPVAGAEAQAGPPVLLIPYRARCGCRPRRRCATGPSHCSSANTQITPPRGTVARLPRSRSRRFCIR